jgi:glycosyltransferase involved in cell wall biosynthesis
MNIAFAATRLTKYDAASNYTIAVLEELSKNNKVDLYAFSVEREVPKNVKLYNYTGKNKHSLVSVLSAIVRIYSLTKMFSKYDVVVLVGPDITVLPGIHLAKYLNPDIKLVWDFHGFTPARFLKGNGQKFLTRIRQTASFWSMGRSDCIKVDSNYVKKEVESKISKRNIKVLHIGINTTIFRNIEIKAIKDKHHLNDKFVMIYVGRLVASKRVDFLIKAMPALQEVVLLVVGDGDERDKLRNLVHSLNLKEKVIFIGRISDEQLPKYYVASDVFVTASLHEGFCVPIIESFASGKPVIVPDRTAMLEIAGNGGLVYESGSINDFVSKVQMLKNDSDLREQLSKKALDRSKEFDLKSVVRQYAAFLEGLV